MYMYRNELQYTSGCESITEDSNIQVYNNHSFKFNNLALSRSIWCIIVGCICSHKGVIKMDILWMIIYCQVMFSQLLDWCNIVSD